MDKLRLLVDKSLDQELFQMVLSGDKSTAMKRKIKIRPVMLKDCLHFQASVFENSQVFHQNYTKAALTGQVLAWMEKDFMQLQIETSTTNAAVLVSKKGKVTIKEKQQKKAPQEVHLSHNRKKQYILKEGTAVPFLVDLGVMTAAGAVIKPRYDKFRQINRFLEFIQDILDYLPRDREAVIVDFGCGKSYLTFAMYYYLHELMNLDVRIIGLDLKTEVINSCNRLSEKYGYQKLEFLNGDIASYDGTGQVDMVVTLHACDTATDYALAKAVGWNCSVIMSVPCCQHELNGQIQSELLAPVLKYGLIRERMAALITDAVRANLLEESGYQVQILEFIEMEHTPKNILIRAIKSGKTGQNKQELLRCMDGLNAHLTLEQLLKDKGDNQ